MQLELAWTWNFLLCAVAIPALGWFLRRLILRNDKFSDERHSLLLTKINQFCEANHEDHNLNRQEHAKIYGRVDEHETRISKVEGHLKI